MVLFSFSNLQVEIVMSLFLDIEAECSDEDKSLYSLEHPTSQDLEFIDDNWYSPCSHLSDSYFESAPTEIRDAGPSTSLAETTAASASAETATTTRDSSGRTAAATSTSSTAATTTTTPSGWRLEARNLFLTYPQCQTTKESVLSNCLVLFGATLKWAVVARETHEDGEPHLHVCVALKSKYRSRVPDHLDQLAGKHGNYQAMRNIRSSLQYICKEDPAPLAHGIDLAKTLAKKDGRAAFIAHLVAGGASLSELVAEDPGYMLGNLQKVMTFAQAMRVEQQRQKKTKKSLTFSLSSGDVTSSALVGWLNNNIRKPREFKQKQLWLHSSPNMGKTSLVLSLQEHASVYWAPLEGNNDDLYDDDAYDVVVFDEYFGQRKLTWLNSFLQGGPMTIYRRYHSVMKYNNLPCIILSNFTPAQCYKNMSEEALAPLLSRLTVLQLSTFTSISIQVSEE